MINPIGYLTPNGVFQLNCEVKNSFEWGKQFIPLYTYSQKELITQNELLKSELRNVAEQLRSGISKVQQKTLARVIEENLKEFE
jgi:hypothetical protein